ncbi:MAG: translocation/assembly module TamB domain-containing protein [Nitrospirae bacterium]|nr:translocation/assembly module TamB domain-containing protein [Nitrospirota bacterium]
MKKIRNYIIVLTFTFILGILILILRSPLITKSLKNIIIPELEEASNLKIDAQSLYINPFPLFIAAKGVHITDEEGNYLADVKTVKGYINLSEILIKKVSIQRLVIDEPRLSSNKFQMNNIIRNIQEYLKKKKKTPFKVHLKVIDTMKGSAVLKDDDLKITINIKGLDGELIIGQEQRLRTSVKSFELKKEGWPEIICDLNNSLIFKKDGIQIKHFNVGSHGSVLKNKGFYSSKKGVLRTEIQLIVETIKRIFNLQQKGEGKIFAQGEVKLEKTMGNKSLISYLNNIFVDIKLHGNFYLETLMELLKVKEQVEGFVDFNGKIKGPLSDIEGEAKAKLKNGNLFGVDINTLESTVSYADGIMKFENGHGLLYGGVAKADASIHLPVVDFFTLHIKFNHIDSSSALKLINLKIDIPKGKVDGELTNAGKRFNPEGWFTYNSQPNIKLEYAFKKSVNVDSLNSDRNVLDRIKNIKGNYQVNGNLLLLNDLELSTPLSYLSSQGSVNLSEKILDLKSTLSTQDVSDLTLPVYKKLKGTGNFSGEIKGTFENPKISGKATIYNLSIDAYKADNLSAVFSYEKNLLDISNLDIRTSGEEHILNGKIFFPEAKELFDLSMPVYNLTASIKNADLGKALKIFNLKVPLSGKINTDINIKGKHRNPDISGEAYIEKASIYHIPFDLSSLIFFYKNRELSISKIKIKKGASIISGEGQINTDKKFSYRVSSEKFLIKDIGIRYMPDDAIMTIKSEGSGTFDNPYLKLNAKILGGTFKGKKMGSGSISAIVQNKDISVNALLFNEKMKLNGKGHLNNVLPWSAELIIESGRYDFIVSSLLKDVPEDLQLNLEGRISINGDRKNFIGNANINRLILSLYGQTFTNDSQIDIFLKNKNISFSNATFKSGTSSLRIQGGLKIGEEYDLIIDGSSSLEPLKGLSKKIGYLAGNAEFVFSVTGKWEKPQINGGMSVSNASFGLKDYSSYISSINGQLYFDEDRFVMHSLSGKIGGGNIDLSGFLSLKSFKIKRFYLDAKLNNITLPISEGFTMNFNGNLIYKGTPDKQNIIGDIKIKRAHYREMVEWRTWLITTKPKKKPKTEPTLLEKADLNVRITGSENITIDNNLTRATVKIRGDMIVKGNLADPILFGKLESTDGYIYFRNNIFEIVYASADFADPYRIKPILNLTALTSVKGYNIRLNLEGQLDHFNLSLSSEPYLEEVDILALLTVGQIGKQLRGLEGGIGAGEATAFITGETQDIIEERITTLTGVDRFQVEPYVSTTTGTIEPRITVSDRLIGDKLFVSYTTSLNSTEEQIIKIEYLLDKNISLIGVRDEKGSLGGDIKFRFGFK